MEETEYKGYFSKKTGLRRLVSMRSLSPVVRAALSSWYGKGDTFTRETHAQLLDRKGEGRELFLLLLILICLRLKIIPVPN